jgi:hypothetical protein
MGGTGVRQALCFSLYSAYYCSETDVVMFTEIALNAFVFKNIKASYA